MKTRYILLISCAFALFSCRKQHSGQPFPMPVPPVTAADTPLLQLKDMAVRGFPTPFYHFSYNDSGYIDKAVFADGLSFYDLTYANNKIREMAMNKDVMADTKKDKLEYDYDKGNLTGIRVIDKHGVYYKKCLLTFSDSRQLTKLEWDLKQGDNFVTEEILQFTYYTDGNLERLTFQTFPVGAQTAGIYQDTFENYDDKPNADGFALLHVNPFFLHFVLFPSVHLQKNNPHRVIHSGNDGNSQTDYTYTYDAKGRPLTKAGDFSYTSGPNAGQHASLLSTFSYYN